ncbi:hypothetical protein J437_LFUL001062, partial [Ladona fulva]
MAAFEILSRIKLTSCTFRVAGCIVNGRGFKIPNYGRMYSSEKKLVGFVGLGNMGGPMALNLINKGHPLIVFDVNPESMASLADQGALLAKHPADVASRADTIITMLPSNKHEELAPLALKVGAAFLDAPVSGGVNAAKGGTLTFMVGGPSGEVEAAQPLLLAMGSKVVHCGSVGSGQAAKICNNMLLGISMIGTAEAMHLGINLGLDPKLLMDIVNSSSGRCWSSELYNPVPKLLPNVPASNEYKGGFNNRLMTKDLGLAQTAASKAGVATPLGALAHQIYSILSTHPKFSDLDFSSVFKFYDSPDGSKS